MFSFAVMRAIEIMGEAAVKVSRGTRERFGEVPWGQIIGMRNQLIHAYDKVNMDVVRQTITSNLPPVIQILEKIIALESSSVTSREQT